MKKMKSIPDVPVEYKTITDDAMCSIETGVRKAMWVVEMLGCEQLEINTSEYNIIIKKKESA